MAAPVSDAASRSTTDFGSSMRTSAEGRADGTRIAAAAVWRELDNHSFAVLGHVSAAGEPRSSGVVYALVGHRLWIAVAPDSWKARTIATGDHVAVTVPVRRGGALALLFPIPPATISFHTRATVFPAGSPEIASVPEKLAHLLPDERRASMCLIELAPEGQFLTYGLGVSLAEMRNPTLARAHVPVA